MDTVLFQERSATTEELNDIVRYADTNGTEGRSIVDIAFSKLLKGKMQMLNVIMFLSLKLICYITMLEMELLIQIS